MEVINATGRRKEAIAQVYLYPKGDGKFRINKKDYKEYFPLETLQILINEPFAVLDIKDKFDVKAKLTGGGINGQAEALKLGIARALVKLDEGNKKELKSNKLLTRDSRVVERKKPGQKKARKKFQFSKR